MKGVNFVTFCYFFTAGNFHKLLFIVERGKGLYSIHRATGERVHLDFFPSLFLLLRGRGVEVNVFFSPIRMKRWKEGERGTFRVFGNVFFIVVRLRRGRG
jgi:hypothetical protein